MTKQIRVAGLVMLAIGLAVASACVNSNRSDTSPAKPARGAGAKSASAARDSGQHSGAQATANTTGGTSQSQEVDGVLCDNILEGIAWCESDTEIIVCASGEWWVLDCGAILDGGFCGMDEEETVDCYVEEGSYDEECDPYVEYCV